MDVDIYLQKYLFGNTNKYNKIKMFTVMYINFTNM